MLPGPAYNWLCVLSSVADIASRAGRRRAAQVGRRRFETGKQAAGVGQREDSHRHPALTSVENPGDILSGNYEVGKTVSRSKRDPHVIENGPTLEPISSNGEQYSQFPVPVTSMVTSTVGVEKSCSPPVEASFISSQEPTVVHTRNLQSSKVPSSRIGRLFHYGGLVASLGYGVASEFVQRSSRKENSDSIIMTQANVKRLVAKLSQMRGAALKLGQFLSIQDTLFLPPEVDKIFRRVQDSAHYMPDWQMEKVLVESLGPDYSRHFVSFDRIPFAAASIGQVHSAVLTAEVSPTRKPAPVAVKIQFPNIAASISSDIGYIKMLLTAGRLLPKGLFLDRTIQVMKQELAEECDYKREGSFLRTFGLSEYLGDDKRFKVPWVWDGSTERVLVMERVDGVSVGEAEISDLSQEHRNEIASNIILLCLKELFEFRMMQTDPNYTNFLYNKRTQQIELVDFGATREYSKAFMDRWLRLLQAAAEDPEDREACIKESLSLGYLVGQENEVMLNAHVKSLTLLATPFKKSTKQPYAFGPGTEWENITKEIRDQIPMMLQHRLTPPPRETYSLNRKLSGAFLLASRLRAVVDTKAIWDNVVKKYRFD